MTREEAKEELQKIRKMDHRIKSVELEIERIESVAMKMTPNYEGSIVSGSHKNKIEEALIKKEEYVGKLARYLTKQLNYKQRCRSKIERIEPESLQMFLYYYYFDCLTMEKISEIIDKSPRWTYELFCTALDKYAEIS